MYFFMYVNLYKFIRSLFFYLPNLFIFSINMHADIHAQVDMSELKKYGQKCPDQGVYMFRAKMTRNRIVVYKI